jgi:protein YIPF5/7
MDDSDIAGPLLFFFLFGTFLLFSSQVHFGYIYGLAGLGSTSLHLILSLMSPSENAQAAPSYSAPAYPDPAPGNQGGHGGAMSSSLTYTRSMSGESLHQTD